MTKEEAKELLPIIQAFAEGKNIQYLDSDFNWKDFDDDDFSIGVSYRIKPESKYRPFKNQEECWQEMLKHQPFGWVVNKKNGTIYNIYEVGLDYVCVNVIDIDFIYAFAEYKFIDGTPFGIKE